MQANPFVLSKNVTGKESKGPSVKVVHQFLRRWLCKNGHEISRKIKLPYGSVYNAASAEAVKAFQDFQRNERGHQELRVDGIVGHKTLQVMDLEIGGPRSISIDCDNEESVTCDDMSVVRPSVVTKTTPPGGVHIGEMEPGKDLFQPNQMIADADVNVTNVGTAAADEWEFGYHQVVLDDVRRSEYQHGAVETQWKPPQKPMRDSLANFKAPFSGPHVRGGLTAKAVSVQDTPFRLVPTKRRNFMLGLPLGNLLAVELKVECADWLIARRRKDPVSAPPCYLEHFEWSANWRAKRVPTFQFERNQFQVSRVGSGKGRHTPDLSTNISNDCKYQHEVYRLK
ncbi:peptidoglycan-binding domain-containing protein [Enhygromyxa salina]|nr:peptidoglycan-binding domain-containing protein [Enhygromyxa salina]